MDCNCILCNKSFIKEEEFLLYNPNPKVGKKAISKLFEISNDTDVQGLSEELVLCLGCHLKLEEVEDVLTKLEEFERKAEEARAEIKEELTNSKDASELLATSRNVELSQTSLDRLVLLKAIMARNTRPTTPELDIEAGEPREPTEEEQNQATDDSENEDLLDSASGVEGLLPVGVSMPKKAKKRTQIPRGMPMIKKQVMSNRVPSNSKGRYALRNPRSFAKAPTQVEESSDEESSSNSESRDDSSSEDVDDKYDGRKASGSRVRKAVQKDFLCIWSNCGKRFSLKCNLARHVKTVHEGRRDFKCTWPGCKKGFGEKKDMNLHVRGVHEGRRDFKCPRAGCGKRFTQSSNLHSHVKTVHEGRRDFKCSVRRCGKAFSTKNYLQKHMSSKHNITGVAKKKRVEVARVITPQHDVNLKVKLGFFDCRMTSSCKRSDRRADAHEETHADN